MTARENLLRVIRFERPEYIPMVFCINDACWNHYPHEALWELMESHPKLFPGYKRPEGVFVPQYGINARKDHPYTDDFGCRWETAEDGITGTVVGHPLADWKNLENYHFPDPSRCTGIGEVDWEKQRSWIKKAKEEGHFTQGGLRHGHTFLQICDICGYEKVLFDMMDEEPKLVEFLDALTEFNLYSIRQYADMGVDMISYPEDLGMQFGPMVSPSDFKKYIMPCYKRMMAPAKEKDILIHMHSDGDIRTLLPYILESGVQVINLQDLVNGIDWIEEHLKGKVCIDLDIDRQKITPFGTPQQVHELIREEVRRLGSPEGGLMMIYGLYPGVPLENVKALMDAMEEYMFYY